MGKPRMKRNRSQTEGGDLMEPRSSGKAREESQEDDQVSCVRGQVKRYNTDYLTAH
jgi:hypothetical protein